MRHLLALAAVALITTPVFAQTEAPGPATRTERHEASRSFNNAGSSAAETARETWHGLKHGWHATKEGVRSGWNNATDDHGEAPNGTAR